MAAVQPNNQVGITLPSSRVSIAAPLVQAVSSLPVNNPQIRKPPPPQPFIIPVAPVVPKETKPSPFTSAIKSIVFHTPNLISVGCSLITSNSSLKCDIEHRQKSNLPPCPNKSSRRWECTSSFSTTTTIKTHNTNFPSKLSTDYLYHCNPFLINNNPYKPTSNHNQYTCSSKKVPKTS